MKKIFSVLWMILVFFQVRAQEDVYPALPYKGKLFITNGTVHVGNGQVLENATIEVENGKILKVSAGAAAAAANAKIIDAKGKHVYPGLILSVSDLGLKEIGSGVRGTNDYYEIGDMN